MIPECIGPISSQKNSAQKYQNSARSCAYCSHNSGEVSWLPYSTYFFYFFKGIYGWHTNISFWSKSWRCLIWRFALSKGYRNRIRTTFQLLALHLASYSSIEKSLILLYLIAWYFAQISGSQENFIPCQIYNKIVQILLRFVGHIWAVTFRYIPNKILKSTPENATISEGRTVFQKKIGVTHRTWDEIEEFNADYVKKNPLFWPMSSNCQK